MTMYSLLIFKMDFTIYIEEKILTQYQQELLSTVNIVVQVFQRSRM